MPRKKGMKLDQALKLYIALYCLCFILTWFISVPMLIHVVPQSECLLFVTPLIKYGAPAACHFIGFSPILVAVATVVLIVLHIIQLRSLKAFLRKPGPHSSDYHHRPTHIFWRMVVFHGSITGIVLVIAGVLTAGYATTCENLYRDVRNTVRKRVELGSYGGVQNRVESYDVFADDRSINRYTNEYRNQWGQNPFDDRITCRNILTDPEVHSQLKQNHAENPYYKAYYGFWYRNDIADVGDIRYLTYRNNLILELTLAGAWISFVLWMAILILMLKERHHIKAHLTDESMWGSEFGGASRRSMGSRMSNQSFDKASRYSNQSGSRYSQSRHQSRQYQPSLNGSSSHHQSSHLQKTPMTSTNQVQGSLMNYFNPQPDEVVDVDAALNEGLDQIDNSYMVDPDLHDNSFESGFPPGLDLQVEGPEDPIPLGDEVSMGVISRDSENELRSQPPMPMPTNPNRLTGRRGGRQSTAMPRQQSNGFPRPSQPPLSEPVIEVNYRSVHHQQQTHHVQRKPMHQQNQSPGYRTQLGNQSMI